MKRNKENAINEKQPHIGFSEFFTSENIEVTVKVISASTAIAATSIKAISLWIEERKARKIRVKYKDTELELSGSMSKEKIIEAIEIFSNINKKINEAELLVEIDNGENEGKVDSEHRTADNPPHNPPA